MLSSLTLLSAVALVPAQDETLLLRERELGVMGTSLEIRVLGEDADALERALDAAVAEVQRVEDLMTDWRPSELTRLNDAAGSGPHHVPAELAKMIQTALLVGELTGGAFDVTYAGVGKLWDFKSKPPVIPVADEIERALQRVGYERVHVDLEKNTVELPAGMCIGLGGIAKGYGVDRAMAILLEHGIQHAIVNAGGDLKALGMKHGEPWEIAIRHPRERERVIALLPVSNTCVVTSGDYERFFEHEGRRYHHIIDPRTGRPSTDCMSATVIAPDAALADALATALCVLGPEKGLAIVKDLPRVECLLIDMDDQVHVSQGLLGNVER
jgi:thiamine biosynthesis lipoprotein